MVVLRVEIGMRVPSLTFTAGKKMNQRIDSQSFGLRALLEIIGGIEKRVWIVVFPKSGLEVVQ